MSQDFALPQMGFDMTEAKIAHWMKQEGETVAAGEVLAEIATDKINLELVDHPGGRIEKILVPEGETVPVGTPIVRFGDAAPGDQKTEPPDGDPAPGAEGAGPEAAGPDAAATPLAESRAAESRAAGDQAAGGQAPGREAETPSGEAEAAGRRAQPPAEAASTRVSGGTAPAPTVEEPKDQEAAADQADGRRQRVSPLARRLAEERGVDLAGVQGSGPGGRILRDDVLAAEGAATRRAGSPPAPSPAAPTPVTTAPAAAAGGLQELSPIRQAIARRMQESKQQIPHFYLTTDVRMDASLRLRKEIKQSGGADNNITINDIVLKAAAVALTRHPQLNAWFVDGKVRIHDRVNIGIAVPLDEGLIVPALLDCQNRGLGLISTGARDLVQRARRGAVKPEEFTGGTFTTSNLGMFGVDLFQAIINPPQVAILAIGAARKEPVVEGDQVVVGIVMKVCLSCDHRVVDGATGAQFLAELRRLLETPMFMLL